MSFGVLDSVALNILARFFSFHFEITGSGTTLATQAVRAHESKIPFIVASPDSPTDIDDFFEADYISNIPFVIPVGAVSPIVENWLKENDGTNTSVDFKQGVLSTISTTPNTFNNSGLGFSFGATSFSPFSSQNRMLYAPGKMLLVPSLNDTHGVIGFGGTSAAAPFIAGTVALMKEINPDISVEDVRTKLFNASNISVANNFVMNQRGITPPRMINVEKLIKDMIPRPQITDVGLGKNNQVVNELTDGTGVIINGKGLYSPSIVVFRNTSNNKKYRIEASLNDPLYSEVNRGNNVQFTFDSTNFVDESGGPVVIPSGKYAISYFDTDTNYTSNESIPQTVHGIFNGLSGGVTYNGVEVPIINAGHPLPVTAGDIVAVPISDAIRNDPTATVTVGNSKFPLLGFVQNYLTFAIPEGLVTDSVKNVVIAYAGGHVDFNMALKILAPNGIATDTKLIQSVMTEPILTGWEHKFTGYVTLKINGYIASLDGYTWDSTTFTLKILSQLNPGDKIELIGELSGAVINHNEVLVFVRNNNSIIMKHTDGTGGETVLVNEPYSNYSFPRFSDDFSLLIFSRQLTYGSGDIGIRDMKTGTVKYLVLNNNGIYNPVISPNNLKIAYYQTGSGVCRIVEIANPSNILNLPNSSGCFPLRFYDDEYLMYYSQYNNSVIKTNGVNESTLYSYYYSNYYLNNHISRDNNTFLFSLINPISGANNISIYNFTTGVFNQIEFDNSVNKSPVYSLDSKDIYFSSDRTVGRYGISQIFKINLSTNTTTNISNNNSNYDEYPEIGFLK